MRGSIFLSIPLNVKLNVIIVDECSTGLESQVLINHTKIENWMKEFIDF